MIAEENLPNGWAIATLEDLILPDGVFVDGDWVERKDQDPTGGVRLIQLADIGDGTYLNRSARFLTHEKAEQLNCTFLRAGDVLIARMPQPLGRACIFPGEDRDCITVVDVCILRTGLGPQTQRWLMWTINAPVVRRAIASLQSGVTRQRISRRNLATISLPVPPVNEQDRIVTEIEKQFAQLDDAVNALHHIRADLQLYRAAVLKAACEGRLVPTEAELARQQGREYEPAELLIRGILEERRAKWEQDNQAKATVQSKGNSDYKWKQNYREPQEPIASDLPDLPEGWKWANLGQLAEIQGGIQKQPKRKPKHNSYPFLRVANVLRGRLDLSDIHQIELFDNELKKLRLLKGDLLIVEGNGSIGEIGRMALWNDEIDDCVHQNHIIRARLWKGVSPHYVSAYWNAPSGSRRIVVIASSTSGLYTLSVGKVSLLPIPLPPLAEQRRIVYEVERRLEAIDRIESIVRITLERTDDLRRSILKRAFDGRLVDQDERDETASMLLETLSKTRETTGYEVMKTKKRPRPRAREREASQKAASSAAASPDSSVFNAMLPGRLAPFFGKSATLSVEDFFQHTFHDFEDERSIANFFEMLTAELLFPRLVIERTDDDKVFLRRVGS